MVGDNNATRGGKITCRDSLSTFGAASAALAAVSEGFSADTLPWLGVLTPTDVVECLIPEDCLMRIICRLFIASSVFKESCKLMVSSFVCLLTELARHDMACQQYTYIVLFIIPRLVCL